MFAAIVQVLNDAGGILSWLEVQNQVGQLLGCHVNDNHVLACIPEEWCCQYDSMVRLPVEG